MRSRGERVGAVSRPVSERTGARELSRAGQMILLREWSGPCEGILLREWSGPGEGILLRERNRAREGNLPREWRGAAGLIWAGEGVFGPQIAADPGGAGEGSGVRVSVLG